MRVTPGIDLAQLLGLGAGTPDSSGTAQWSDTPAATRVPGYGAPAMGGGSNVLQSVLDEQRKKKEDQSRKLREKADALTQEASQLQLPKPQKPLHGLKDLLLPLLIGGIAKLAFHAKDRDLAEGGAGFMQARQGMANDQNQFAQQQFQDQRQGLLMQAQSAEKNAGYEQADADRLTNQQRYEQGRLDTLTAKADAATEKRISDARNAYDRANLEGEKRRAASVLQKLDPSYITPDQVEADVRDLKANNLQRATSELAREINNIDRGRGFVDDANGSALEARAQSIAKQYGVDRASLPIVPTGTTLQKQHYDQLKSQFDQTFKFRSDSFKTTTAQAWARIEIAKKQLEISREGLGLRAGGLDLSERRFQYQINKDAGLILGSSTKELVKARHDLAVEQAKLDQMKARNPATFGVNMQDEATAKQKAKVQDMQDEVAALENLQRMAGEEAGDSAQGSDPRIPPNVADRPGVGLRPNSEDKAMNPNEKAALHGGVDSGAGRAAARTKPAPKTKPKASAPKGQQVYSQGGVTIRKRG